MSSPKQKRPSGSASIDGDFSISDFRELNSSVNNSSTAHKSSSTSFHFDYVHESEQIAKEDDKSKSSIGYLKISVVLVLTLLAVTVSLLLYFDMTRKQKNDMEVEIYNGAMHIANTWERNIGVQIRAMESFGIHVASWADGSNSLWPNVTVPDFDIRGTSALAFSQALSVVLLPIVTNNTRTAFEQYTQENLNWVPAGERESVSMTIARRNGTEMVAEQGDGPFFPAWTIFPVTASLINLNFGTDPSFGKEVEEAYKNEKIVIGSVFENGIFHATMHESSYIGEPISAMFMPVFQRSEVVALLTMSFLWTSMFENIDLQDDERNSFFVVLENGCNQEYSFKIRGSTVVSEGAGDNHDHDFDKYEYEYPFDELVHATQDFVTPGSHLALNGNYCPYRLRIFGTDELQDTFQSADPILYAFSVLIVFFFTVGVFGCYDAAMERQLQSVLQTASEARAIVASLFPQQFRGRLFEHQQSPILRKGRRWFGRRPGHSSGDNNAGANDPTSSSNHTDDLEAGKNGALAARPIDRTVSESTLRLRTYLSESVDKTMECDYSRSRPIADLFPHTTVLFADICGFTSWCSQREPEHVFQLLEAIFKTFDKIARKRDVFKVETIGDCYMCVTGVPEPQDDHAWRMAKFALDARTSISEVLLELDSTLGPDTSDLVMRFGMHSGPTTAGVLRGHKSRFQLFGDTVNTASRMESTGVANRIQLSQATADILKEAGRGGFLRPRADLVQAKGKGLVQTFWLASRSNDDLPTSTTSSEMISIGGRPSLMAELGTVEQISIRMGLGSEFSDSEDEQDEDEGGTGPSNFASQAHMSTLFEGAPTERKFEMKKRSKVIMWQSELLIRSLKLIVARRGQLRNVPIDVSSLSVAPKEGTVVIDEVVHAIPLPDFDARNVGTIDPEDVVLSRAVLSQVHDYVALIASMHTRGLPFHNFEHATHVAMSASKLLHRVLVPDIHDVQTARELHISTNGINSDPLIGFALVFAALIHDVDHPGVGNTQLAKEDPDLALLYKNQSIAEQKSFDIAWDLLMDAKYLELRACIYSNEEELKRFRQLVVNCVMATDFVDAETTTPSQQGSKMEQAITNFSRQNTDGTLTVGNENYRQATIIIEMIMQVSDVAHTMQHWHVFRKWNERLFCERMQAYRLGRLSKDPSDTWYEQELSFFDNYVIPLAERLDGLDVFGFGRNECLSYAMENRREWESKGKEVVLEMLEALDGELAESWRLDMMQQHPFDGSASISFEDLKD